MCPSEQRVNMLSHSEQRVNILPPSEQRVNKLICSLPQKVNEQSFINNNIILSLSEQRVTKLALSWFAKD